MAVKLLLTWDILPGREQEYFEFVVRDFIPEIQRMGMEPSDAWFTMYGNQPQILAAFQIPSMNSLQRTLNSNDWQDLTQRLMDYVENYDYKIVQARNGFQMRSISTSLLFFSIGILKTAGNYPGAPAQPVEIPILISSGCPR